MPTDEAASAAPPEDARRRRGGGCPNCGARQAVGERFCLRCRCEFATGTMPAPPELVPYPVARVRWEAHIDADHMYFQTGRSDGMRFPAAQPLRIVPIRGERVVIGRRNRLDGRRPLIDLSVPVEDEGVSAEHAVLERTADGSYQLVDHGSRNGTRLNDRRAPLPKSQPVPVRDGDEIFVGAWSRITIRRVGP
ncbi:FHA domain-containing protein [Frankia sp. CiP3]|uniref:FHA domain-containing protein n=1 Tax=Frankia sp. CiP3 TaxID=2880971 RepID=UPI001EF6E522|nr:FHA domain-containing protein [Frankia sp. CiP3]